MVDILKNRIRPTIAHDGKQKYLEIWARVLTNDILKVKCSDALHIIELLLITPFTNAKLERMFSRMNRVKTDWRNKLGRERLDSCLRISEEGESIEDFNPDGAIEIWYEQKVRRISAAKPHRYPEKRQKSGQSSQAVNIAKYTLSDLEETDTDSDSV